MATWGRTNTANHTNSGAFTSVLRLMGGTSPNLADMVLESISLDFSGSGQQPRIALYTGGTASDPTGATLVEDLGRLTINGARGFYTINSTTNPTIPQNALIWIAFKHGVSGPTGYWSTSSADAGDFQTARGRDNRSGATGGNDPATAFPATLDGTASFANAWYAWYLDYSIAPAGPTITGQPVADVGIISNGQSTVYTTTATGTTISNLVWREDGSTIGHGGIYNIVTTGIGTGSVTSTLTITRTSKTNTPWDIRASVTDANGTTETNTVTDTWWTGPVVTTFPATNGSGVSTATLTSDYVTGVGEAIEVRIPLADGDVAVTVTTT